MKRQTSPHSLPRWSGTHTRGRGFLGTWAGLVLLTAALAPWATQAQTQAPTPTETPAATDTEAQRFTLANGMTLIVKPDRRAPTAIQMLWVRVGAMDEVDGASGLAHALEHMMFKGSDTLAAGEFSRRVAALGGRENAFTNRDATVYHQQVAADQLEAVMRLEADRFANNRWSDDEFAREIEVIKEERRMRTEESPRTRMYEQMTAMAYLVHPYRRPVVGWMQDLNNMRPDDARDFYRRWYVPANAAVVVVGDVDVSQVRAWAERYYGRIPARAEPARKPRSEPAPQGTRRLEYRARAKQALLSLAWPVPRLTQLQTTDETSNDALALSVLADVLSGSRSARLNRTLVQGQGPSGERMPRLADSVRAYYDPISRGPALFSLNATPAAGVKPETLEAALKTELARVARDGVSAAELQRVKTQWQAGEVYAQDSIVHQASDLGNYWLNQFPLDSEQRLMARVQAVTAEQVQAVAQRYFDDTALTVGVLRPEEAQP